MSLDFVTEPARQIDVIHQTDVLVVGSGPGGLAAALGRGARRCRGDAGRAVRLLRRQHHRRRRRGLRLVPPRGRRSRPTASAASSRSAPRRWARPCPRASRCRYELDSEGFKLVADRAGRGSRHPRACCTGSSSRRSWTATRSPASSSNPRPAARRSWPGASSTRPATPTSRRAPARRPSRRRSRRCRRRR